MAFREKLRNFNKKFRKVGLVVGLAMLIVIPVVWFLNSTNKAEAVWYDDSFNYREVFRISNTGAEVTNQKVKLDIDTSDDVTANRIQGDCGDSRFTDQTGVALRYYLDSAVGACNTASTDYYVLLPKITGGTAGVPGVTIIYHYYGNPNASDGTESAQFSESTFSPSATAGPSTMETAQGPALFWMFDEGRGTTANDTSPNSNSGTVTAAVYRNDDECIIGNCLYFDGNNDYVSKAYSTDVELNPGTESFSVTFWAKHPTSISAQNTAIARYNGAGYKIYLNSTGNWCFAIDGDSTWTPADFACTTTNYADNQWHQVVAIKNGTSSISIYVDSANPITDSSIVGTSLSGTSPTFYVGIDSDGASNDFLGLIDNVKYYNYAKTGTQIRNEFTSRGGLKGSTTLGASLPGGPGDLSKDLIAYYKFDEGTGTTVNDASGNGQNLTLGNGATYISGKYNTAGSFDGTNDIAYSPNNTYFDMGANDDFTVSAWVYRDTATTWDNILSARQDSNTTSPGFELITYDSDEYSFLISDGTEDCEVYTTQENDTASWIHVVGVLKRSGTADMALYLNGVRNTVSSCSASAFSSINSTELVIGAQNQASTYDPLDGRVDDVRIYRRALTPAEVQDLYSIELRPTANWKLDDNTGTTAIDSEVNNITTQTFTGDTKWVPGKYGNALYFDGDGDVARITEVTAVDLGATTDSYGVSAWIKTTTNFSASASIIAKNDGSGAYPFDLYINSSEFACFQISDGTNSPSTCGTVALNDGAWHHVMGVRDSSTNDLIYVYVDGVRANSTTDTTATTANNDDLSIGNAGTSYVGTDFTGTIDDVRVYSGHVLGRTVNLSLNSNHPINGGGVAVPTVHYSFDERGSSTNSGTDVYNRNPLFPISGSGNLTAAISGATRTNKTNASGQLQCKIESCVAVTGTTNTISAADPAFLDGLQQMTVTFWVYPTTATVNRAMVSKDNTSQRNFMISTDATDSDEIRFHVYTSAAAAANSTYLDTSNANLTLNQWQHVAAVFDGTQPTAANRLRVYMNGRQVSGTVTGTPPATMTSGTTSNLIIGDDPTGTYAGYLARYDEVKIYTAALSINDILADRNGNAPVSLGGVVGASVQGTEDPVSGVIGPRNVEGFVVPQRYSWWRMDESNDSTTGNAPATTDYVTDFSGNLRHGTATNSPTFEPCISNNCLRFTENGTSSSYISLGTLTFDTASNFILSAWIYPTDLSDSINDSIFCGGNTSTGGFCLYVNDTNDRLEVCGNGDTTRPCTNPAYSTNNSITANTWNHIMVMRTAANAFRFYINGRYTTSDAATGSNTSSASTAYYIGYDPFTSGQRGFDGNIDDLQLIQATPNARLMAYMYNRGVPLLHLKADECVGTTLFNSAPFRPGSARGGDGTITIGSSGTSTAGSCGGGSGAWNNGKIGSAIELDGTDDYITVTNNDDIDLNSGLAGSVNGVTWSAWIYPDGAGSGSTGYIFYKGANNYLRVTNLSGGFLDLQGRLDLSTDALYSITGVIPTGQWSHVALSYDDDGDDEVTLWVNGKAYPSVTTFAGGTVAESNNLIIGSTGSANYFDGRIDEVRVYNYELNTYQMGQAMRGGAADKFE